MSLLDAVSCPYCAGALLKESYYFRCPRDHRFTSTVQRPQLGSASTDPGTPPAAAGIPPEQADRRPGSLVLLVVGHPDRREIGRLHTYPLTQT